MKKVIGWILMIVGGLFCISSLFCIPVVFLTAELSLLERFVHLTVYVLVCIGCGAICLQGIRLKSGYVKPEKETKPATEYETFMSSQLPALYLRDKKDGYRDAYNRRLMALGFTEEEADKLFRFECGVIQKYGKSYLLDPRFTKNWFFGLKAPFFQIYPMTQADVLKEKSLTISELCKIIDEAEWHFWNSHEKVKSDAVWTEIAQWRLKGEGGTFAIRYFGAVAGESGISEDHLAKLVSEQGAHLSRYKWG